MTELSDVTIPEGVKTIGGWAFQNSLLENISLPSTLISIGDNAFADTNLSIVNIPEGVKTIGAGAFTHSKLKSVSLPSTLTSIGDGAFSSDTKLKKVVFFGKAVSFGVNVFGGSDLAADGIYAYNDSQIKQYALDNGYPYHRLTPAGHDSNDYLKLVTFLDLPSADSGKTNGQQLNAAYDPDDPATWTGVSWNSDTSKRVTDISLSGNALAGALDVSGMGALQTLVCSNNQLSVLDVSGCDALFELNCDHNALTALNATGLQSLRQLMAESNQLNSVILTGCNTLTTLSLSDNLLQSLDISALPLVSHFECLSNPMTQLHVTVNERDFLFVTQGDGFVGMTDVPGGDFYALATPDSSQFFFEWITTGGPALTDAAKYTLQAGTDYSLTAYFVPPLKLDMSPANGQIYTGGRVTITPNIPGGGWDYSQDLLSVEFSRPSSVFTGLAAGNAQVTYTVGSQSAAVEIYISQSQIPQTGQDFTPALLLLTAAIFVGCAALAFGFVRRRRQRAQ
jgi:hypothetical protein